MNVMSQSRSMTTLDGALLCTERGLHVIPVWRASDGRCPCPRGADCISPGKHPVIDSWQTAATTDLMLLRDWFHAGRHNVGVVCGPSNVLVVDVDPRNDGHLTFRGAHRRSSPGPLPATVTANTGGGGQHSMCFSGRSATCCPNSVRASICHISAHGSFSSSLASTRAITRIGGNPATVPTRSRSQYCPQRGPTASSVSLRHAHPERCSTPPRRASDAPSHTSRSCPARSAATRVTTRHSTQSRT